MTLVTSFASISVFSACVALVVLVVAMLAGTHVKVRRRVWLKTVT